MGDDRPRLLIALRDGSDAWLRIALLGISGLSVLLRCISLLAISLLAVRLLVRVISLIALLIASLLVGIDITLLRIARLLVTGIWIGVGGLLISLSLAVGG